MHEMTPDDATASPGELSHLLAEHVQEYAIFFLDREGHVRTWTDGAQRLFGYREDEILGKSVSILFTPEDVQQGVPEQEMEQARVTGRGADDRWHVRQDGSRFWANGVMEPLWDESGRLRGFTKILRDRSEWKRVEQAHEEIEASKAAVMETALDGIITIDQDDRILEFNPAAERLFGYRRSDVLGEKMGELIVPERLRADHYRGMQHYLSTGEGPVLSKRIELPALRADGSEVPVELAIVRVPMEKAIRFTGYIRDITDRKAQESRRAAQLAVTGVLAEAPTIDEAALRILEGICRNLDWDVGALWLVDESAQVLRCLQVWHPSAVPIEQFECSTREVSFGAGEGLPGRVWEDRKPRWVEDVCRDGNFPRLAAASQVGLHTAFAVPLTLGAKVVGVIEFLSRSIGEPDNDLLSMMATVGGQIGQFIQRKRAEEALRQAHDELEQRIAERTAELAYTNRFLRALLESIHDGIVACDAQGELTLFNQAAVEFHGSPQRPVSADQWATHYDLRQLDGTTPMTKEQVPLFRALNDEPVRDVEMIIAPQEGPPRTLLASGRAFFDEQGSKLGAVVSMRDITSRKRAEEALRRAHQDLERRVEERTAELAEANEALRQTDQRKDEFLAMLAHELRNPLAPIRSGLELLALMDADGEIIQTMQQQVEHLVRLVDDLLDVSRIMRGRIELRRETVDLASVVERGIETARPLIDSHSHRLTTDLPAEPILLHADPIRLAQVISNLLNNAAKYTPRGGRIALTTRRHGDQAVIRVRDTGIGIEPDLLPHVFVLFRQSERSLVRSHGGLGIGLTLVKRLVEMHDGEATVHSEGPGQGSEFTIHVPAVAELSADEPQPEQVAAAPSHRILLVDDNRAAATMMKRLLERLGDHHVVTAQDGISALDVAKEHRPEIILLDIGLPEMDGYEVARRLRQQPEFEETLIVALTGYGTSDDRRKSLHAGCDDHLVKPPDVQALRRLLAHPKLGEI